MLFNFTLSILSPLLSISSDVVSMQFNGSSLWVPRTSNETARAYTATLDGVEYQYVNGTKMVDVGGNLTSVVPVKSNLLVPPAHTFTFEPAELVSEISWASDLACDTKVNLAPSYLWGQFWKYGFSYANAWVASACSVVGTTDCYSSDSADASISLKFKGDGITVYGALEHSGSGYSVSLDGAPFVSYSASQNQTSPTTLVLAHFNNIGSTDHVLVLKNNPDTANPGRLEIDGIDVFVYQSDFSNLVINDPTKQYKSSNPGKIAIGAGVGAVLLLAIVWLVWMRIRRIRARRAAERAAAQNANPTYINNLERDLEAAKDSFVASWVNRPTGTQTMSDRDSTTSSSSRANSMHEKEGEKKDLGYKPSEYGEPIPPAFALQLKNIAKQEKELKTIKEISNPTPSRSWNPFNREKKDQA